MAKIIVRTRVDSVRSRSIHCVRVVDLWSAE
jgi:hypothetical protein